MLEINIKIGDTVERHELRVKELEAVGKLGMFNNNYDLKISSSKFKVQSGLIAAVECCGFDAKCNVLSYETIRISKNDEVERTFNKGGGFEEKTRKIIMKAELGDIYIFRQIMSKCPGVSPQRLKDMVFEIE